MFILANTMYMCKFMFIDQYTCLAHFFNCLHNVLSPFDSIQNGTAKEGGRAGELTGVYMFMCVTWVSTTCSLMLQKLKVSLSADILHGAPWLVAFDVFEKRKQQ
jgi:hypothetical protein